MLIFQENGKVEAANMTQRGHLGTDIHSQLLDILLHMKRVEAMGVLLWLLCTLLEASVSRGDGGTTTLEP